MSGFFHHNDSLFQLSPVAGIADIGRFITQLKQTSLKMRAELF